ncbi:MAG: TonB-dependent receptor plug domain-containing protein, partial [Bacteroidota bacterium]
STTLGFLLMYMGSMTLWGQVSGHDSTKKIRAIDPASTSYTLTHDQFNQGLIHDPWDLIRGRIPGLIISRVGYDQSVAPTVRMRGIVSAETDAAPLVVVDDMIGVPLQLIDPHDIAEITLIKGGPALAAYGVRAGGGVLLVKTKRTIEEGLNIQYRGAVGIDRVATYWELEDRAEFLARGGIDYGASTDWQDEITQTGWSQSHHLSALGKTKNGLVYRGSVNFRQNQGLLIETGFEQWNGNFGAEKSWLDQKLKLQVDAVAQQRRADLPEYAAIRYAMQRNPTMPVTTEDPNFVSPGGFFRSPHFEDFNPVSLLSRDFYALNHAFLQGNVRLSYEILSGLTAAIQYTPQYTDGIVGYADQQALGFQEDFRISSLDETYLGQVAQASLSFVKNWKAFGIKTHAVFQRHISRLEQGGFLGVGEVADFPNPPSVREIPTLSPAYQIVGEGSLARVVRLHTGQFDATLHVKERLYLSASVRRDAFRQASAFLPGVGA